MKEVELRLSHDGYAKLKSIVDETLADETAQLTC